MKAIFGTFIGGFSGRHDGLVYYYNHRLQKMIVRKAPVFVPTEQNARLGKVSKRMQGLRVSDEYKKDFMVYTELYRKALGPKANNILSWYNLFVRMMWQIQKQYQIDLSQITMNKIYAYELPCISIKTAVEAELLPIVPGYEKLNNLI